MCNLSDFKYIVEIILKLFFIDLGDDCIAINGGSSFINITDVKCGPGHGIRLVLFLHYFSLLLDPKFIIKY